MSNTTPENLILLCGELLNNGGFSHTKNGEDFFEYSIKITLPEGTDVLPVLFSQSQIDETIKQGSVLSLTGTLISEEAPLGEAEDGRLKILAQEVYAGETEITSGIFLTGNVIRKPYSYFLQDKKRAEFQIAVGKEDGVIVYVPVSASGELATIADTLRLGDTVSILGQLHSYEYLDLQDAESLSKTAYEVEILTFTALPQL